MREVVGGLIRQVSLYLGVLNCIIVIIFNS